MAEQAPRNVYRKIAAIMAEMEPVPKTGRNDFHKYNFIKAEVLFASLQRKLGEAGIVIIPRIEKVEPSPDGGKVLLATMSFRVVNADDPADFFDLPWAAQGSAGDDKAVAKCATSGMKYALMRLFFISDEEDPDAEDGSGQAQPARGAGQRQQGGTAPAKPKDTTARAVAIQRAQDLLSRDPEARAKLPKPLTEQTDEEIERSIAWLVRREAAWRQAARPAQPAQNGHDGAAEVDADAHSRTQELTAYVNDVDAHLQAMKGTRGPLTAEQRGTWAALYTRGQALTGVDASTPAAEVPPTKLANACALMVQSCLAELSGSEATA